MNLLQVMKNYYLTLKNRLHRSIMTTIISLYLKSMTSRTETCALRSLSTYWMRFSLTCIPVCGDLSSLRLRFYLSSSLVTSACSLITPSSMLFLTCLESLSLHLKWDGGRLNWTMQLMSYYKKFSAPSLERLLILSFSYAYLHFPIGLSAYLTGFLSTGTVSYAGMECGWWLILLSLL